MQNLHNYVQGRVFELVFTLDEVGISDWEDCKSQKVIVAGVVLRQTIHHDVCRNVKDISVIFYLSAAEKSLLPSIVISYNSTIVQEHLKKQGVRFGRDFALQVDQKP
jgi:hypothetical protein